MGHPRLRAAALCVLLFALLQAGCSGPLQHPGFPEGLAFLVRYESPAPGQSSYLVEGIALFPDEIRCRITRYDEAESEPGALRSEVVVIGEDVWFTTGVGPGVTRGASGTRPRQSQRSAPDGPLNLCPGLPEYWQDVDFAAIRKQASTSSRVREQETERYDLDAAPFGEFFKAALPSAGSGEGAGAQVAQARHLTVELAHEGGWPARISAVIDEGDGTGSAGFELEIWPVEPEFINIWPPR